MIELDIKVRVANIDDIDLILSFIAQKAEFDGCPHAVGVQILERTRLCRVNRATINKLARSHKSCK